MIQWDIPKYSTPKLSLVVLVLCTVRVANSRISKAPDPRSAQVHEITEDTYLTRLNLRTAQRFKDCLTQVDLQPISWDEVSKLSYDYVGESRLIRQHGWWARTRDEGQIAVLWVSWSKVQDDTAAARSDVFVDNAMSCSERSLLIEEQPIVSQNMFILKLCARHQALACFALAYTRVMKKPKTPLFLVHANLYVYALPGAAVEEKALPTLE